MNAQFDTYFLKALYDAKIADIRKKYPSRKGYSVRQHIEIDKGLETDVLVTKKGEKSTIFEIIMLPILPDKQDKIEKLRQKAQVLDYNFRLVAIAKPVEPLIEIEWLDEALLDYLIGNEPQAVKSIATHVEYDDLETDIQSIKIADEKSSAYVNGSVFVNLKSGFHSERKNHNFPFQGKLLLNLLNKKIEAAEVIIDTMSW